MNISKNPFTFEETRVTVQKKNKQTKISQPKLQIKGNIFVNESSTNVKDFTWLLFRNMKLISIRTVINNLFQSFLKTKSLFQWLTNLIKMFFLGFFETLCLSSSVSFTSLNFIFNDSYKVNQEPQVTWKCTYNSQVLIFLFSFFNSATFFKLIDQRNIPKCFRNI